MRGIYSLAEELLASQETLCCMELLNEVDLSDSDWCQGFCKGGDGPSVTQQGISTSSVISIGRP